MSQLIEVQTDSSSRYPLYTGRDRLDELVQFMRGHYDDRRVFLVIDGNVDHLHGKTIRSALASYFKTVHCYAVPPGESAKNLSKWQAIVDFVLENGVNRNTPLVAAGGGVTGDLAGFAAASVMRGIPLIHLPTTLLAMVDSSIGGKTGVNHMTGKNLVGAFYQPDAILSDIQWLETLPVREWVNGTSEILKYGCIRNSRLLDLLRDMTRTGMFVPNDKWLELIRTSAAIKVDVVRQDVLESGVRAHLNFGHTFGHAMEAVTEYGTYAHGEAVFVGMLAAGYVSNRMGAQLDMQRLTQFCSLYKPDLRPVRNRVEELIDAMKHDKKVKNNTIRLVLLHDWEAPYVRKCMDHDLLQEAWHFAFTCFET